MDIRLCYLLKTQENLICVLCSFCDRSEIEGDVQSTDDYEIHKLDREEKMRLMTKTPLDQET